MLQENFIFSAKLVRYEQDLMQDLASLARKILASLAHFLQDGFYWFFLQKQKILHRTC